MSNVKDQFTLAQYRMILNALKKADYLFIPFPLHNAEQWKYILLRHDIDFSPERALSLALEEKKLDIPATYFINPHSYWYNAFDADMKRIVKHLVDLGHYLGLHFDPSYWQIPVTGFPFENMIQFEKKALEGFYNLSLNAVSLHNPTPEMLATITWDKYAGLVNCNSDKIRSTYDYVSDSGGRLDQINIALDLGPGRIQLLTHPVWWTVDYCPVIEKVRSSIRHTVNRKFKGYLGRRKIYE